MRTPHYWKRAGARSAPSEIIVFDCETHYGRETLQGMTEHHTLRLGVALAYRLDKGKRTRQQRITFRTVEEFWVFLRSRLNKQRPVWLFAHNIAYDLGVVGGWRFLAGGEFKVKKLAVSGQLFYVKCEVNGCGLVLCDTCNFYHCSLAQLGKSLNFNKWEMPDYLASEDTWEKYCTRDVEVTAAAVDALIEFIRSQMLGPFQCSIAGLAFSAYRSRFMKDKILVHNTKSVLEMERNAYYGGIVDTAFVGTVPTDVVYELDVCSMYPSVCMNPLPVKKVDSGVRVSSKRLCELTKKYMVIADVELETHTDTYPVRCRVGTYFPHGRYRTSLAHPELCEALRKGHVKWVYQAAWYTHAPIFADYMKHFTTQKIAFHKSEQPAFESLCKYYANSLYGKTGQLSPTWREWCEESLQQLCINLGYPPNTLDHHADKTPDIEAVDEYYEFREINTTVPLRHDYGILELKIGESESRDSCPAIAACVTSYARVMLREYQRVAGYHHWFYSDTDSVWVDREGLENLTDAGCVCPDQLGKLAVKGEHRNFTVYGPKDYASDRVRRLKGVRASAVQNSTGGWEQLQFPSALTQIRDGSHCVVRVRHITKKLKREITRCRVNDDGFTVPLVFPRDNPDMRKKRK